MAPDLAANGSRGSSTPIRTISVVAPVRNEGANVDHFISDLAAQDFRGELEVLVADGNSEDEEVVDAEVVVGHLVSQHEVHGREQLRRNGDNRLLGTPLGLQTLKLRMGIGVAAPNRRRGCAHACQWT